MWFGILAFILLLVIGAVAVLGFFGYYAVVSLNHANTTTTATFTTATTILSSEMYPNPLLTPGDVLTTDASVVCVPGYAASVRDVPESEKNAVYAEYGVVRHTPAEAEVDHLVSLELGGSDDIRNLWVEPYEPRPGAHEKDKVENYLHREVCAGRMSLVEAQREIATDWYGIYVNITAV
jgi:hypothetical protein